MPPLFNQQDLNMAKLDDRLASLATMSPAQLSKEWEAAHGAEPPGVPGAHLRRLLAQRLQEKRHGGLPLRVARELDRVAQGTGAVSAPAQRPALTPGTRLIREWNGQTIAVEVTEAGFCWQDRHWRSLSQIARAVTGAHWSGPRFFGLTSRG